MFTRGQWLVTPLILAYLGLSWSFLTDPAIWRSGRGAHLQTWLGSWPRCPPEFPSPRSPHPPRRSLSCGELWVACNVNHQSTIFGWFIVKIVILGLISKIGFTTLPLRTIFNNISLSNKMVGNQWSPPTKCYQWVCWNFQVPAKSQPQNHRKHPKTSYMFLVCHCFAMENLGNWMFPEVNSHNSPAECTILSGICWDQWP